MPLCHWSEWWVSFHDWSGESPSINVNVFVLSENAIEKSTWVANKEYEEEEQKQKEEKLGKTRGDKPVCTRSCVVIHVWHRGKFFYYAVDRHDIICLVWWFVFWLDFIIIFLRSISDRVNLYYLTLSSSYS